MKTGLIALLVFLAPSLGAAERRAKNVILFLGDAAGVATISAASVYAHGRPHALFLHTMPHVALVDTSTASQWVTDSAAGMTAIVTGRKTHNGVISQAEDAERGVRDGTPLKTILEYAEERGLATGVITNSPVADATPAACYAHANDRRKWGEIFAQVWQPRFGDGVDLIVGPGRERVMQETQKAGFDLQEALKGRLFWSLDAVPDDATRPVVLLDGADFDLAAATARAIRILSRDPDGFFLMVESDCHTNRLARGLQRVVALDDAVRQAAQSPVADQTLILVTADHSYDFRVVSGRRSEALLPEEAAIADGDKSVRLANVRRDDSHTGEDVIAAAQGPGAERVRGFLANTDLFGIMLAAWGWKETPAGGPTSSGSSR
jgi:alkaline phosphatase